MKAKSALSIALAAGIASTAAASNTPTKLSADNRQVQDIAHIYFNVATGEKVVTLLSGGQTAPAGATGTPLWSSLVANPCTEQGFTTSFFFGVDDNTPNSTGVVTSLATAVTNLDYGDIATDTVVDMVHLDWVVDHEDTDTDSDSIGDGVVGLAGQWTYFDADNGRAIDASTRLPLISFTFLDLPGNVAAEGFLSGYTIDVDLAGTFSSSLTFELGDTDGDLQGAAVGNNDVDTDFDGIGDGVSVAAPGVDRNFDGIDDADLDGDGLFDWSWGVRFYQPGTDSDGDGIADGDPADSMHTIGISFGIGEGTAVDNGDGTWTWDLATGGPDNATGQEDRFAIYAPPDGAGEIIYAGGFWFGGMACVADANGQYAPLASFEHQLIAAGGNPCPQDFNGDGSLNFFDISAFLAAFSAMDAPADFNGDGSFNFFDISEFLAAFSAGCP